MLINIVNGADVGVVEGRGRTGLAPEPLESLIVSGKSFWQEFEGNEPPELSIFSLENYTHPAAAQLLENAVMGNCLADHGKPRVGGHLSPRPEPSQRAGRTRGETFWAN
jgi:hypothetical protein